MITDPLYISYLDKGERRENEDRRINLLCSPMIGEDIASRKLVDNSGERLAFPFIRAYTF